MSVLIDRPQFLEALGPSASVTHQLIWGSRAARMHLACGWVGRFEVESALIGFQHTDLPQGILENIA